MGIGTVARALRTGLVALLLILQILFVCTPGFSQDSSGEDRHTDLSLKHSAEVARSQCKQHYRNPLNLLFLLPGLLFFIFALATGKYRKSFFIFGLLALLGSSEPRLSTFIRRAEESFASGNYGEALQYYEQAEGELVCNSALLYDLGVVSFYEGHPGYAVHYIRRSLRLAPADRQARSALQAVEKHFGLAVQVAPPFPVHPDVGYLLVLIFANVAFVMGAFVVRTKKVQFLITLVLVAILVLGCLAFFVGRVLMDSRSVGVVVSKEGELFRVPEEDSKSWFELPAGTSLWIKGRAGSYYLVETPSQIDGWVRSDTILID